MYGKKIKTDTEEQIKDTLKRIDEELEKIRKTLEEKY